MIGDILRPLLLRHEFWVEPLAGQHPNSFLGIAAREGREETRKRQGRGKEEKEEKKPKAMWRVIASVSITANAPCSRNLMNRNFDSLHVRRCQLRHYPCPGNPGSRPSTCYPYRDMIDLPHEYGGS